MPSTPYLLSVAPNDVDETGKSMSADLPAEWLHRELESAESTNEIPGHVSVRLSRTGGTDILVRGRVKAGFSVPCARCLGPAPLSVNSEMTLFLKEGPPPHQAAPGAEPSDQASSETDDADASVPARRGKTRGGGVPGAFGRSSAPKKEAKRNDVSSPKRAAAKRPRGESSFYEFSAEEADVDYYDRDEVVLDPFIREALLLEVPIFPLCSVDCPGIAPGFQSAPEDSASHGNSAKRPNPFEVLRGRLDDPKE